MSKSSPVQLHMASYAAMQDTPYDKTGWARSSSPEEVGTFGKIFGITPTQPMKGTPSYYAALF